MQPHGRSAVVAALVSCLACDPSQAADAPPTPAFTYELEIPDFFYGGPKPPTLVDQGVTHTFGTRGGWTLTLTSDTALSGRVEELAIEFSGPCGTGSLLPADRSRMKRELQSAEGKANGTIRYDLWDAWEDSALEDRPKGNAFVTVDAREAGEVEVAFGSYVLPKVKGEARVFSMPAPICDAPTKVTVDGEVVGEIGPQGAYQEIVVDAGGGHCYERTHHSYSVRPKVVFDEPRGPDIVHGLRVVATGAHVPERGLSPFPSCPQSIRSITSEASCNEIQPVECPRAITAIGDPTVAPVVPALPAGAVARPLRDVLARRTWGSDPLVTDLPPPMIDTPAKNDGEIRLSLCVDRRGKSRVAVVAPFASDGVDALFRDTVTGWRFRPVRGAKGQPSTECTLVEYDVDLGPA